MQFASLLVALTPGSSSVNCAIRHWLTIRPWGMVLYGIY